MKAMVYYGPGELRLEERPAPRATADTMVVRIEACAICGTDLKLFTVGNPRCKPPRVIGHELVGEVVEVGRAVSGFAVGDRVTFATSIACNRCELCGRGLQNLCPELKCISYDYDGGFQQLMEAPAAAIAGGNAIAVPDGVGVEAALSEPLSCVVNAQKIAGVGPGDTVVVLSAGPLGCLHAECAKAFGAARVIVTEVAPARLALARQLDGVEVLDVSSGDAVAMVREATGGRGADVVMAVAPVAEAQEQAIEMVRKGGAVNLFGSLPKEAPMLRVNARTVHYGQIAITGASDSRPCDVQDALGLLAAGEINTEVIITHRLPLERLVEGIEMMGRREGLKILVMPNGEAAS